MSHVLRFAPEVEDDLVHGCAWYKTRSEGLDEAFLEEFNRSVERVADRPLAYRRVRGDLRRCLMRRFPYAIYFEAGREQVVVLGLFHCARDPGAIDEALRSRIEE